jgi:small-conductance mechanosensitive channel
VLLVLWPVAVLLPLWAVLMVAYVLAVQQPPTSLSAGLLLSLIGASALARSITLRWQRMLAAFVVVIAAVGVLSGLYVSGPPEPVLAAAGLIGLIAGFLLNRDTFWRSGTYRRPTMALGLAPPR